MAASYGGTAIYDPIAVRLSGAEAARITIGHAEVCGGWPFLVPVDGLHDQDVEWVQAAPARA